MACEQKKVAIGVVINLSGVGGKASEDIRDGALLGVRKINSRGGLAGRKLVLYLSDDENSPEGVIKADTELINEKVYAIIGHSSSDNSVTALPLVNKNETVLISAYTATARLLDKDDFFIRTSADTNQYAYAILEVLGDRNINDVVIIKDLSNESFVNDITKVIKKKYNGRLREYSFSSKNKKSVQTLAASLFVPDNTTFILLTEASMTALFSQKIRQKKPKAKIIATVWAQNNSLFQYGGKYVEDIEIISFIPAYTDNLAIAEFDSEFYTMFKRSAGARAHRAYELIQILTKALKKCGFCRGTQLKKTIINMEYDTILGKVKFNRYGDTVRPMYLLKTTDNQFVVVKKINIDEYNKK